MNKYLSYEKSKRLAELGYELDHPIGGYWLAPLVTEQYKQPEPMFTTIGQHSAMDYMDAGGNINQNLFPSPDCHDLLMELQKHICKQFYMGSISILKDSFKVDDYSSVASHPNPVEALGEALIKILEEKQ